MQKWKLPSQSQDPLFQRTYLKPLFIQMRCPGCAKLYKIDTRDLKTAQPHFDCIDCQTPFTIEADEKDSRKWQTRALKQVSFEAAHLDFIESSDSSLDATGAAQVSSFEKSEGLSKCPKCQAFNPKLNDVCGKCGVIFSKLDQLPMDSKMGALPSLVRAWHDLLKDYSDITKHMAFVDRCEDLQAVPYALKKYQDLREAQPHDEIAQKMHRHTIFRAFAKKAESMAAGSVARIRPLGDKVNWGRVLRLSPFGLSLLLILIGVSHAGLRNMIGVGVSVVFIVMGMALLTKGRIHWLDFWGN